MLTKLAAWLFGWYWRRVEAAAVRAIEPCLRAQTAALTASGESRWRSVAKEILESEARLLSQLDQVAAVMHSAARADELHARSVHDRLTRIETIAKDAVAAIALDVRGVREHTTHRIGQALDELREHYDRLHQSHMDVRAQLAAAGAEIASQVERQAGAAIDRVFESPATHLGAELATLLASPAGEAVRYAVQKSASDTSMTDNATRRREALQSAKRWLREHGHDVPSDADLGFMVEAAVRERKSRR